MYIGILCQKTMACTTKLQNILSKEGHLSSSFHHEIISNVDRSIYRLDKIWEDLNEKYGPICILKWRRRKLKLKTTTNFTHSMRATSFSFFLFLSLISLVSSFPTPKSSDNHSDTLKTNTCNEDPEQLKRSQALFSLVVDQNSVVDDCCCTVKKVSTSNYEDINPLLNSLAVSHLHTSRCHETNSCFFTEHMQWISKPVLYIPESKSHILPRLIIIEIEVLSLFQSGLTWRVSFLGDTSIMYETWLFYRHLY